MLTRFTRRRRKARPAGSAAARSQGAARRAVFVAVESLEQRALFDSKIGDVFYIALENHNFTQPASDTKAPQQLLGNPAAPFLNSLVTPGNPNAAQTSYASAYHNVLATPSGNNPSIHPSEPNYIWAEGGSNFGVANDADPYAAGAHNVFDAPNLSGLIQDAGISWKSYQEDIDLVPTGGAVNFPTSNSLTSTVAPQNQWTVPTKSLSGTSAAYTNPYYGTHQYNYAVKHDGQLFFTKTNGGTLTAPDTSPSNPETPHYAPLQQLQSDLANDTVARYTWITPNQFNDMHSSLNTDFTYNGVTYPHNTDVEAIAIGDHFLSVIIPQIMASQAYKNNGAIVIWNDETEGTNANDFSHTSTEIVISPLAKGNAYNSTLNYTHSSDVKTMQEVFGVHAPGGGFLQDANSPGTNDLRDLFKSGVISPGVLLTDPHGGDALSVSGNSTVTAPNGGAVVVNSDSDHAVSIEGGSSVNAGEIDVTGSTRASGKTAFSQDPVTGVTPTPDPIALSLPAAPAATFSATHITGADSPVTLSPGTYVGGISVSGDADVTLLPGVYFLQGGGFSATDHATVHGAGVLLVNAAQASGDGIHIDGHADVQLSAPTDLTGDLSPDNGVVILQDATSSAPIDVIGHSTADFTGVVYAAGARLDLTGGSSLSVAGTRGVAGLILSDLSVQGGSDLTVDY